MGLITCSIDNRPLKFEEFEHLQNNVLYVEIHLQNTLKMSEGLFVEQIIRPTGVLDPIIEIRKSENQIDDLIEDIIRFKSIESSSSATKMAQELTKFLHKAEFEQTTFIVILIH